MMIALAAILSSLLGAVEASFSQNKNIPVIKTMKDSAYNVGDIIKMPMILFDLDPYCLCHPSNPKDSLERVVEFMYQHKNLVLELNFNTDYRSDARYNQILSYNRAKTCADYMTTERKIAPERLIPKGYGENNPAYIITDTKTPSGKIIKAGTRLTQTWIDKNLPNTHNKDDYEFMMCVNRRAELKVLRTDLGNYKTLNDSAFEKGNIIPVPGILFSLDKPYILNPDTLKFALAFLNKYQNICVEISCHTDYRSDSTYNLALSLNRAKEIFCFFHERKIDSARITYNGYGENNPMTLEHNLTLPSGKTVYAWTTLTKKWIDKNFPMKNNKDDYEFLMRQNRRTELKVLRTDFGK